MPRAISILLMFLTVLVLIIGIFLFAVPPLIGQIVEAVDSLPDRFARFDSLQAHYEELESQYPEIDGFEDRAVDSLGDLVMSVS